MSNPLFEQWFRLADEDRDGVIGGMEAVKFFQRSGLPQNILGEIWDYASGGGAALNLPQFCNAVRLVSLAQMNGGRIPQEQARGILAGSGMNIPPPKLQGLDSGHGYAPQMTGMPYQSSYVPQVTGLVQPGYRPQMTGPGFQSGFSTPGAYTPQTTGGAPGYNSQMTGPGPAGPYGAQMTGGGQAMPVSYPAVTPKDIQGYQNLFAQLDQDADNFVQGGEVAGHFLPSGLDKFLLRDIWAAVAGDAGKLNQEQFVKFAYLVEVSKKGIPVPKQLPPGQFPPVNTLSSAAMSLSSAPRPPTAMAMPASTPGLPPAGPPSMGGGNPNWTLQSQFGGGGMQAAMDQAYSMNVSLPQLPPRMDAPADASRGPYQSRVPGMPDGLMGGLKPNDRNKLEDHLKEAEMGDKKLWGVEGEAEAAKQRAEQYKKALQDVTMFKSRTDVALLQAQEQANRLQQEAAALERQYQSAYSGAEGQFQQGQHIRGQIQKLLTQKNDAHARLSTLQADLQRVATMGPEEMQRLEAEVAGLVDQVTMLESQRAAYDIQMEGARQQKELLTKKIADLQMATAAAEAELDSSKKDVRDLMGKVDAAKSSSDLRMVQSLLVKAASAYKTLYHHAQAGGLEVPYEAQLSNIGQFMWSEDVLAGAADWMDTDANNRGFVVVNAFPDLDALPSAAAPPQPVKLPTPTGMSNPPISMFAAPTNNPAPVEDDPFLNSLAPLPPAKKPTPPAAASPAVPPVAATTSFEDSAFGESAFASALGAPPGSAAPKPAASAAAPSSGFDDAAFGVESVFGAPPQQLTGSGLSGFDDNAF